MNNFLTPLIAIFKGKESTSSAESSGETPSAGERPYCEKANGRHAQAHADIGPLASTGSYKSLLYNSFFTFQQQVLFISSPSKKTHHL